MRFRPFIISLPVVFPVVGGVAIGLAITKIVYPIDFIYVSFIYFAGLIFTCYGVIGVTMFYMELIKGKLGKLFRDLPSFVMGLLLGVVCLTLSIWLYSLIGPKWLPWLSIMLALISIMFSIASAVSSYIKLDEIADLLRKLVEKKE